MMIFGYMVTFNRIIHFMFAMILKLPKINLTQEGDIKGIGYLFAVKLFKGNLSIHLECDYFVE